MKNLIVGLAVIFVFASLTNAQSFDWAFSAQGEGVAEGNAVCMDADGNSYITGYFTGKPFVIGKISLTNTSVNDGNTDMFVAKLDKAGKVVWAMQSKGVVEERGIDIACDKTGHIVVVGTFKGEKATFGTTELVNPTRNPFLNIHYANQCSGENSMG